MTNAPIQRGRQGKREGPYTTRGGKSLRILETLTIL